MDNIYYVISAIKNDEKVYLAEDSSSGGYCYWSTRLESARKFDTLSDALKYDNCSFSMIVNETELNSVKVQVYWIEFDDVAKFEDMYVYMEVV